MNDYEVTEEQRAEVPTITITENVAVSEIGQRLGQMLAEAFDHILAAGAEPVGAPFTRYYSMSDDAFEMEAGFVVDRPIEGAGRVRASTLPGGAAAVTWHIGPYEAVSAAYEAVEQWMQEHGKDPNGPPWETFWTDPTEEPDPSKWRTEVVWPLRQAA